MRLYYRSVVCITYYPVRKENMTSKLCQFDVECRRRVDFRTTFDSKSTCKTTNNRHRCRIDIVSMSSFRTRYSVCMYYSSCSNSYVLQRNPRNTPINVLIRPGQRYLLSIPFRPRVIFCDPHLSLQIKMIQVEFQPREQSKSDFHTSQCQSYPAMRPKKAHSIESPCPRHWHELIRERLNDCCHGTGRHKQQRREKNPNRAKVCIQRFVNVSIN